jgi:hypothetical protein
MAFVPDAQPATKSRFVPDAPPAAAPVAATPPAEPGVLDKVGDALVNSNPLVGAVEKAGQGATGLLSKIAGGYAGLARLFSGGGADAAADTVHAVQDAGTYQPRSYAAHVLDQAGAAVEKPFDAAAAPIDKAVKDSNNPVVQAVAPAAAEAVGDIAGLVGPGKAGGKAVAARAAESPIVEGAAKPALGAGKTAVETGRSAGFKFTPAGVESRMPDAALKGEIPQAPASLEQRREINLHNQAKTTELAGQQIGKDGATELSPADFDTAKKPHQKTYTDTGSMLGDGLKGSDDFVNTLKARLADNTQTQLKGQAASQSQRILNAAQSGNLSGPQMVKDISWLRQNGGRSVAKMLEDEMERQLGAGNPQLQKFRDARTGLAQINNLQEVTKGGQIDARALAKLDADNPGLLTGNLKIIAQSAAASPQDFGLPSGIKPGSSPVSKGPLQKIPLVGTTTHAVLGAVQKGIGYVAKKVAPSRLDVTSDSFQNRFGREATPTERSYMQDFARKAGLPTRAFELEAPEGSTGVTPAQRELTLPPGLPPRPGLDLEAPEGRAFEPHQPGLELPPGLPPRPGLDLEAPAGEVGVKPTQLGMQLAQGRPLEEQRLGLKHPEGTAHEPHQPSLLGHPGTPEGGSGKKKAKKRGSD